MKKPVKIAIILSIIAVIIAASAIVGTSVYRSSPNYLLSTAERYLTEMNYEQAVIAFEKYLEIEPRDAEAWLKLADAYYQSGNLDKAIETLEQALTFVDDERIRAKLAEYMLEKYPPVTTTTAPKEEPPEEDGHISFKIVEPNVDEIIFAGCGMYVTFKDEKYAFTDVYGNLKTGYDYSNIYRFFGSSEKYAIVSENGTDYILIDGSLNHILSLGSASGWYFFNEEEPLIAVTYAGTVEGGYLDGYTDKNFYIQIYRCKDGELLYSWSYCDWIDGVGTTVDLKDERISPIERTVKSNGTVFTFDRFDIDVFNIKTYDDNLYISFTIGNNYYASDYEDKYKERNGLKKIIRETATRDRQVLPILMGTIMADMAAAFIQRLL